jgi:outer membrane immunogenic protein
MAETVVRKSLALALAVTGVSSPVVVAGMSSPALAAAPTPVPAGLYIYGAAGGGWFNQDQCCGLTLASAGTVTLTGTPIPGDGSYNLSGGLVGGGVGYNFVQGRWVFGLEADDSWSSIKGSGTCGFNSAFPHGCGGDIRWLATVRGRLGWDFGPLVTGLGDTAVYATGGLAVGDIHAWDSLFGTSGDKTATGWTVGVTLETMLNANWSFRLDYLHVDLGNPAVFSAIPPQPEHVSTRGDLVRAGLTYYFSAPPPPAPPVITKAPRK